MTPQRQPTEAADSAREREHGFGGVELIVTLPTSKACLISGKLSKRNRELLY